MRTNLRALAITSLALAFPFQPAQAIELPLTKDKWISTGKDNSQEKEAGLFLFNGNTIRTISTETNIHSHYRPLIMGGRGGYTYESQVRIDDKDGGIGVTFHSRYNGTDKYYRIRRYGSEPTFHIAPHPDPSLQITEGITDTGVSPDPGFWYNVKVLVQTTTRRVKIRAKVWEVGTPEPRRWQVDCSDASELRINRGRFGVWSMGSGLKRWRNLRVNTSGRI